MSIYKSAIEKPVTTVLIFVAVIVIGVYSFIKLPVDQFPEMDPPYITVMTTRCLCFRNGNKCHQDYGECLDIGGPLETYHVTIKG